MLNSSPSEKTSYPHFAGQQDGEMEPGGIRAWLIANAAGRSYIKLSSRPM